MSVFALKTFSDLYTAVREELGLESTDTTALNRIKRDINIVYQEVVAEKRWWWLSGKRDVQLPAFTSTGTVSVTQGSATVTLSTAPTASKAGYYFSVDGFSEIYRIDSHTASSTTVKLSRLYAGTTNTAANYKIWTDRIALPVECKETVEVWHDHHRVALENVGLQEFRRLTTLAPKAEGKPRYYYTGEFEDFAQTSSISSLPALSTRASAGLVKTLVFASGIPTSIVTKINSGEPVRWRISAAGDPSYNGDIIVASVATTTSSNDTITYIGVEEKTESATADTAMNIVALDQEADFTRTRGLYVYPALSDARVTIHLDFVKEALPLENDSDEPLLPMEDRVVLLYGALHRAWSKERNPEEAARNLTLYSTKLAKMAGKLQDTFDTPRLAPNKRYLTSKRSASRTRLTTDTMVPIGGSSSGRVVTGTANMAAVFNSEGELAADSNISTTELGYLNGVSSNIQTQLDAITTLADGKIYVGNASNAATEVTMSGDITLSNAGVAAIAAGAIVNADINSSAAIAHSKMAALTASRAMVTDGSGVASASSVTSTELGYLSGVTSALQTQLNAITTLASGKIYLGDGSNVAQEVTLSGDVTVDNAGVTAIGAGVIVNADINGAAAIARSKTATGTAYRILANDSSGVMSENAAITASRAVASDANGQLAASATTATELGYLSGVTSAIQTQLDSKVGLDASTILATQVFS